MHAGETGKPIELNSLFNSKPEGYIAKLQYTTHGIDGNYVYLSSAHRVNELGGSRAYVFGKTFLYRLTQNKTNRIARIQSEELSD